MSATPSAATAARLLRRANAAARVRHPNLVRMLSLPGGAGLAPVLGAAHRLSDFTLPAGTFKRFDLEQVVRLLIDVCSGLSALHDVLVDGEPFVHGCVSPQHIYIDEHGTARVVPLLPAHFSAHARVEYTGYVAPERVLGEPLDARADVFSVGVMLWEALAGTRLSADGLLAAGSRPPRIQLSPRLRWAEPLCAIAERAIARDPRARFATVDELSRAMERAAADKLPRADADAWQDEAPTPVFQPRLHLATLRSSTPPPAVLSLPKAAELATAPTLPELRGVSGEPPPPSTREPASGHPPPASQTRSRSRGGLFALSAIALGVAIALPTRLRHTFVSSEKAPAAAAQPPAVPIVLPRRDAAPPRAPTAVPDVRDPAAQASSAAPPPSAAAPSASHVDPAPPQASDSPPTAVAAPLPEMPRRRVKAPVALPRRSSPGAKLQSKERNDDYGI